MGKKCQEEQIQSNSNRRITTFLIVFVDIFIVKDNFQSHCFEIISDKSLHHCDATV